MKHSIWTLLTRDENKTINQQTHIMLTVLTDRLSAFWTKKFPLTIPPIYQTDYVFRYSKLSQYFIIYINVSPSLTDHRSTQQRRRSIQDCTCSIKTEPNSIGASSLNDMSRQIWSSHHRNKIHYWSVSRPEVTGKKQR